VVVSAEGIDAQFAFGKDGSDDEEHDAGESDLNVPPGYGYPRRFWKYYREIMIVYITTQAKNCIGMRMENAIS
jgi:hypothetical protein